LLQYFKQADCSITSISYGSCSSGCGC